MNRANEALAPIGAAGLAMAATLLLSMPAAARTPTVTDLPMRLAQPQLAPHRSVPAARWHGFTSGSHTLYGTIVGIDRSLLSIRLRNGRVVAVDASGAIASGSYSMPLFVGKSVCVDGAFRGATFVAAHIFRTAGLGELAPDR